VTGWRRERREAIVAALIWLAAAISTRWISYSLGYGVEPSSVGGVPSWVVWGVFVPWVVFFFVHCWYTLWFLRDEDEDAE